MKSRRRRRNVSSRTASGLSPGLRAPACCRIEPGLVGDPVPVPCPPWAPEEAALRASFRLCSSTAPADDIRIDASLHPNNRPRPTQKSSDRRADEMGLSVSHGPAASGPLLSGFSTSSIPGCQSRSSSMSLRKLRYHAQEFKTQKRLET